MKVRGRSRGRTSQGSLRQDVLIAALECSGGDLETAFTAEDLLLAAWKRNPAAWGLRGHEAEHPDSERIYVELDRATLKGRNVRGGMVGLGLLDKVRQRTYRLTPAGLLSASQAAGAEPQARVKAERQLADAVNAVLSHEVLQSWLGDPAMPKYFRDAGHFWGIAPGTPPTTVRSRVGNVDKTLEAALSLLDELGVDEISARHGRVLFERKGIERAMEFQATLKQRFAKDLIALHASLS